MLDRDIVNRALAQTDERTRQKVTPQVARLQFDNEPTRTAECIVCGTTTPPLGNGKGGAFYTKAGMGMTAYVCTTTHARDADQGTFLVVERALLSVYRSQKANQTPEAAAETEAVARATVKSATKELSAREQRGAAASIDRAVEP